MNLRSEMANDPSDIALVGGTSEATRSGLLPTLPVRTGGPASAGGLRLVKGERIALESSTSFGVVERLRFRSMEADRERDTRVTEQDTPEIAEEKRVAAEARKARDEAVVRERGERECMERLTASRGDWELESEARVIEERQRVRVVCETFALERERYFAGIEDQVVRLSLSIAQRVLHRESKIDPLLLEATVRMALAKMIDGTKTVLWVPEAMAAEWRKVLAPDAALVEVKAEERMEAGECRLETSMGTVELGVEAQLMEIERGFFDLMQRRPV